MSSADLLGQMAVEQRNRLEMLLVEFDQGWTSELLTKHVKELESESDLLFREAAIAELVKIDLLRRWQSEEGIRLESYFEKIPWLGSVDTVSPHLILAEYEARLQSDPTLDQKSYRIRFPKQYRLFRALVESELSSDFKSVPRAGAAEQASIDTSRIGKASDTKSTKSKAGGEALPEVFGRYRILRELGSGAMGTVYLAHDTQLDRQVAFKTPSFSGAESEELVERFYREARAAAKLQHRNICPVFDVGEIDGRHFISMAFVKGHCMSDYIKSKKRITPKVAAVLVHRLAVALAEAHRHNVVHRDLKPANIMIDTKREPVVMDFGLARQTDIESRMTQTGMALGTPAYMSPEQVKGEQDEIGPGVDIYALGVILYELLTGQLPFQGPIAKVVYGIVNEQPKSICDLRPDVDTRLEAICNRMMAKEKSDRYQSMDEVAGDIKALIQSNTKSSSPNESDSLGVASNEELDVSASSQNSVRPVVESSDQVKANASDANVIASQAIEQSSSAAKLETVAKSHTNSIGLPVKQKVKPRVWIAISVAGVLLIGAVLGLILTFKTPNGTLRIETIGELEDLEVLVDGNTIDIGDRRKAKATDHQLQLRLGDSLLKLDPSSQQFVMSDTDDGPRLSVMVGQTKLTDSKFQVARRGETILRIEVVESPESRNEDVKQAESIASSPNNSEPSSEEKIDFSNLFGSSTQKPPQTPIGSGPIGEAMALEGHRGEIVGMEFTHDGKHLISFGADKKIVVWDLQSGERVRSFDFDVSPRDLATSPTDPLVAVCGTYGRVEIYDWEAGRKTFELSRRGGLFMGIDFSPDGKHVVSVSLAKLGKIWNAKSGELLKTFPIQAPANADCNAYYLPQGNEFLVVPSGVVTQRFQGIEAERISEFRSKHSSGRAAVSGDGKQFVRSGFDGTVTICSLEDEKDVITLPVARGENSVEWSADGKWIAVVNRQSTKLVDTNTLNVKHTFGQGQATTWAADFSPDSQFLATSYDANSEGNYEIKIWRLRDESNSTLE